MNIKARIEGSLIIVDLEGQVDFESTTSFRDQCQSLISSQPDGKVVLNMKGLRFVGSTGINQFVQALKDFTTTNGRPRICEASSEFTRLIKAFQSAKKPFHFFENEVEAIASFETLIETEKPSRKKNANA